ncbi:unnamed protein product [Ambrosiozyma monospora]|uniref:DNA topoisomerase (ATP-hydrolyzing) n=1 Tax=Ambrosiozyma monospora TaxID=43982 RepID=A0A9W6Z5U2_AMBMO|nr:unnamed protein product [Ambrosiozyma monospora]
MADNIRSLPSVMDGFKPSQRKILYGCFLRNLKDEIKVAQLAGYISEKTGYHHGEQSLMMSIISLAQDFVGSNNLNILRPNGAFGSRAAGGKDASAPRYIFTEFMPITKKVFNPEDNPLLTYMQDDEQTVEPEWYLPVIPMILVNGAEGIGSGWSSSIPPFNPVDIVNNIRALMNGEEMSDMIPWFKGWEGTVTRIAKDKFRVEGNIEEVDDNTIEITELPARMWTIQMKEFLLSGLGGNEKMKPWIKDMEEQHTTGIRFVITLSDEEMEKTRRMGLKTRFKLISSISTSNMVAFDPQGRIKKYTGAAEIIEEYYHIRLDFYQRRKDYLAQHFSNQLEKLSYQARFIKMVIEGDLVVSNKKRTVIIGELQKLGFPGFDKDNKPVRVENIKVEMDSEEEEELEKLAETTTTVVANKTSNPASNYDYLLGLQIWSLTRERYEKLLQQRDAKEAELNVLLAKSAKDLWNIDLDEFLVAWDEFLKEDEENRLTLVPNENGKKKQRKRRAPKAAGKTETKKAKTTKTTTAKKEKTPTVTVKKEKSPSVLSSRANSKTKSSTSKNSKITDFVKSATPEVKTEKEEPKGFKSVFGSKSANIFGAAKKSSSKFNSVFSAFSNDDLISLSDSDDDEKEKPSSSIFKKPSATTNKTKPKSSSFVLSDDEIEISDDETSTKKKTTSCPF